MDSGDFAEIFVATPIEICEERDPKGLYKKARAGQIPEFTGISAPYEPPIHPELIIHTEKETVDQSAQHILQFLEIRQCIPRALTSSPLTIV